MRPLLDAMGAMSDATARFAQHAHDDSALDRFEGVDRIALLPIAQFIAVVPAPTADEPAYVFIAWTTELVERPFPGTAIWRAALERYLAHPDDGDPTNSVLRPVVEEGLHRLPNLTAWLAWPDKNRSARTSSIGQRRLVWPGIPQLGWGLRDWTEATTQVARKVLG